MKLDEINDIEWFRKQLKKQCVRLKKTVNDNFQVGEWYFLLQDEGGVALYDENHNFLNLDCFYPNLDEYIEVIK